jgi:hypothetical protein
MVVAVRRVDKGSDCGVGSGSGWVQLAPLERGGQGGSNGTKESVVVAILADCDKMDFVLKIV